MATIRDLAKETNYSVSTISKAFSNSTDISEETRKVIIETAKKIGYEIKSSKRRMKGKILILTKDVDARDTNSFFYDMVYSFITTAMKEGYSVTVEDDENFDEKDLLELRMNKGDFSGCFVLGYTQDEIIRLGINSCRLPVVALDNIVNNPHVACIGSDSEIAMALAIDYLMKLGHSKVAMLSGEENSFVAKNRKRAFTLIMQSFKNPVPESMWAYSNFLENQVAPYVDRFLANGATAIVCASDLIAKNVIDYLLTKGVRVPEDVSVIGYDNSPVAVQGNIHITTLDQNASDIGKTAFSLLMQVVGGVNISKLLLRPKLIKRDSAGPVRLK